jgi:hypothetical protein
MDASIRRAFQDIGFVRSETRIDPLAEREDYGWLTLARPAIR